MVELLDGCRIRSIIRDSKDRLWIATWRKYGLLRYDHGEVTAFTVEDGLLSDVLRNVCEREDGAILVGLTGGANVIEGDRVTEEYGEQDGIVNTEILNAESGFNGDILLGSNGGGIYVVNKEGTKHIGLEEGLGSEIVMKIKKSRLRDVYWIVTGSSIAYMTPDYQVTTIDQFPYSNNFDIYENSQGKVWVISSNGIYVSPVEKLLENKNINPVLYGLSNGLPCIANANSYCELTEEGDLYLAGTQCVAKVNIEAPMERVTR